MKKLIIAFSVDFTFMLLFFAAFLFREQLTERFGIKTGNAILIIFAFCGITGGLITMFSGLVEKAEEDWESKKR